jgi:predicted ABC-class ATPase
MRTAKELEGILHRIDGKGYKAYKELQGSYDLGGFTLGVDYVQGDPFASPSRIRGIIPAREAGFPPESYSTPWKKEALKDYLTRNFHQALKKAYQGAAGTGKSGMISIDAPGQEVLDRTSIYIDSQKVEVRLEIGLPAAGRRVLGRVCKKMVLEVLPPLLKQNLYFKNLDQEALWRSIRLREDQEALWVIMKKKGWIAFVANGSILPRESGISQKPLTKNAVPFQSPKSMEETVTLPYAGEVSGMAVKQGVNLIVGGGYHGKSTLLQAIELGVYPHIHGDGRELCLSDPDGMKIRAEDGRWVEKVNISPFINNLPHQSDTRAFSTENASGSTSQAANIIEALEGGAGVLLIDEDTSATNFMIRDDRMKKLVHHDKEPITPFIDKVRSLYRDRNVSTILVIGGSGDYFDVADQVIMMDQYIPRDVTREAKAIARRFPRVVKEDEKPFPDIEGRVPLKTSFPMDKKGIRIKTRGTKTLLYNRLAVELYGLEQLISPSQTSAVAAVFRYLIDHKINQQKDFRTLLEEVYDLIEGQGLEGIAAYKGHPGNLAKPRKLEVLGALNRYRNLNVR